MYYQYIKDLNSIHHMYIVTLYNQYTKIFNALITYWKKRLGTILFSNTRCRSCIVR